MKDDDSRARVCPRCGERIPDAKENRRGDLVSPLDIAKKWLTWCAALIFAQTLGFTALITWREIKKGVAGINELIIEVVSGAAPATPLFVIYAIMAVSGLDFIGGATMVTARYLNKKLIEPLDRKRNEEIERRINESRSEGKEEGIAQGMSQGIAQGMSQGIAQGIAQGIEQGAERERRAWTEWNSRRVEAESNGLPFDEPPPCD